MGSCGWYDVDTSFELAFCKPRVTAAGSLLGLSKPSTGHGFADSCIRNGARKGWPLNRDDGVKAR